MITIKLLSVGLTGTADDIRARLQSDCTILRHEGFRIAIDETNKGDYTFLGCNIIEGELSFRSYERLKHLLKSLVAQILAEIIILREEKKIVFKFIHSNYHYFSKEEQKLICEKVLRRLNFQEEADNDFGLMIRHNSIRSEIAKYLDSNHELVVEGFINFRLKEYKKRLSETVDNAVDDFMLEMEYQEFIRVLKYFIDLQAPLVEDAHVLIASDGNFKILDYRGEMVSNPYVDNIVMHSDKINFEDLLITSLIAIAPTNIVLHNSGCPGAISNAMDTIKTIFEGRVAVCGGCEICLPMN